jgi:formate hydrogenlyase transcriptional activator
MAFPESRNKAKQTAPARIDDPLGPSGNAFTDSQLVDPPELCHSQEELGRVWEETGSSAVCLRKMIDTIPAQAHCNLPDGANEFSNQRWQQYTGLSAKGSSGWGWQKAYHPEDLPRTMEKWRALIATGEPGEIQARIRRRDGVYRWFLIRYEPLRIEVGEATRWYAIGTDIEELKHAELRLETERDRLRLLLDVQEALVANLDLPNLFKSLAANLRRVIGCDFIGLTLPEPDGKLRQRMDDYGGSGGPIKAGMLVPLYGSATGKAFRTRKLVYLDGDRPDPDIYDTPEGKDFYKLLLKVGVPSGYFLPLIHGDDVIAVMQMTKYNGGTFKPQQAEFLTALAGQLSVAVANALEHNAVVVSRDRLARERVYLREEIERSSMFEEIVGSSPALRRVLTQVEKVAPTDSTVLILGETGTGKELIARAVHNRSKRANRAFVRLNCAAIPPSLIASELFGHEKGSFTGALQRRLGRFESADGGTIFLDEIGELPPETQVALLRVLQERELERVGGSHPISIDVRVLTATNRDLNAAVADGTFRKDLFYRINVFPIQVPALRDRGSDIPLLVEYLVDRYAKKAGRKIRSISKDTLNVFQSYDWPGNIRELQNVVERAVILCDGDVFCVDPSWITPSSAKPDAPAIPLTADLAEREKAIIENALRETEGLISGPTGAAGKLGIPRQTLESRIRKLGINRHRFKAA